MRQRFDAFLSYSHAGDGRLAPSLQRGLQTIAKPWYRRRALRIFRDRTTLSATPELWGSIEFALGLSNSFILLASPETTHSQWVEQEAAWWRAHRESGDCLIVLAAGELEWDVARHDFTPGSSVPPSLRGWFGSEPLWVDLRWARTTAHLSLRNARFRDCIAELAAPLRGMPKDALVGEDIRLHRRAMRQAWSAVTALVLLTLVAIALAAFALVQRHDAIDREHLAQSRELATLADNQLQVDPQRSLVLAADAVRTRSTVEADDAIRRALFASRQISTRGGGSILTWGNASRDGRWVLTAGLYGQVHVWDTSTGRAVSSLRESYALPVVGALDADGKLAFTGTTSLRDQLPRVAHTWNARTGRLQATLASPIAALSYAALSPRGDLVATGTRNGTVQLWASRTGKQIATLARGNGPRGVADAGFSAVTTLTYSPGGRYLVVGHEATSAEVWDLERRRVIVVLPARADAGIAVVAFGGPSGDTLLVGGTDGQLSLWRLPKTRPVRELSSNGWGITVATVSPDGQLAVTANSGHAAAQLWDLRTGRLRATLSHRAEVTDAEFSPDGRTVVTASADATAVVWDTQTGAEVAALLGNREGIVSVRFIGGSRILTISRDSRVRTWRVDDLELLHSNRAALTAAIFAGPGRVVTGGSDGRAVLWDASTGAPVRVFSLRDARLLRLRQRTGGVQAVAASADGRWIATVSESEVTTLWDATTSTPRVALVLGGGIPAFTPDSRAMVAEGSGAGVPEFGVLTRADASTGLTVPILTPPSPDKESVAAFSLSRDGHAIAAAFINTYGAGVWNLSGQHLASLNVGNVQVNDIAWSPNGRNVATAEGDIGSANLVTNSEGFAGAAGLGEGPSDARVFDARTGALIAVFRGHQGPVKALAFSPDGREIVSSSTDGTARVWLAASGQQVAVIHDVIPVVSPSFSPDERFVLAISGNRARLWNARTGAPVLDLPSYKAEVTAAQFSPDGRSILTASRDGTARVELCDACGPVDLLEKLAQRRIASQAG